MLHAILSRLPILNTEGCILENISPMQKAARIKAPLLLRAKEGRVNDTLEPQKAPSYIGMPALQVEKYKSHMVGLDMTDAQKEEYLKTLWSIMASFVRLGWGVENLPPFFTAFNNASLSAENMPDNEQNTLAQDFNGNADGA